MAGDGAIWPLSIFLFFVSNVVAVSDFEFNGWWMGSGVGFSGDGIGRLSGGGG